MKTKEMANIIYDTLFDNTDNPQLPLKEISTPFLDTGNDPATITFCYENIVYSIVITRSALKVCEQCFTIFDPEDIGHAYLCSDDCIATAKRLL